jgi:signal transduction histidine kinase
MTIHYTNTNVSTFVNRIASYFEILGKTQQIAFDIKTSPSFSAHLDHDKTEKVILNLLSNAFKFTPQGGCVSITVKKVKNSSPVLPRGAFDIIVADSGPGIPADKRYGIKSNISLFGNKI